MILDSNSNRVNQFENSNIQMFPHQQAALYAMNNIEQNHSMSTTIFNGGINNVKTNFAIYSDKVGAGKTITIIMLIENFEKPTPKYNLPSILTKDYMMTIEHNQTHLYSKFVNSNLIIVPHNLVIQWKDMILKLKITSLTVIRSKKDIENFNLDDSTSKFLLVSNTQLLKLFTKIAPHSSNKIRWNRIVIDEPQILKNLYGCINFMDAEFIWFVCATPGDLLQPSYNGRPHYLNSYFDSRSGSNSHRTHRELQSCLVLKNADLFVEQSLSLPQYNKHYLKCRTPRFYNVVRHFLPTESALERLRANDINGAIETFNCESGSEENIIVKLTDYYEDKIKKLEYNTRIIQQNPYLNDTQKNEKIKKIGDKIDELKNKVTLMKARISDDMCPICLDTIQIPKAVTMCCQNSFCWSCILLSLSIPNAHAKNKCPMCKEHLTKDKIFVENKENNKNEDNSPEELKFKNKVLEEFILNMHDDQRLIIFSEFDQTFDQFIKESYNSNIQIGILKGKAETQMSMINKFNEGYLKVIMMNARYCGSGLNLQMATDIIIYHKLAQTLENQVIGRAQRPGRTRELNITYLQYEDEV